MVCGEEVRYGPKRSAKAQKMNGAGLGTTVAYLVDEEVNGISPEVMQIAMLLEGIQNSELRRAVMEQVRILAGIDIK